MRTNTEYAAFCRQVPEEFEYFKQWARRFPENPKETRYGILVMNATPDNKHMLFADDPRTLHSMHIDYLIAHPDLLSTTMSSFRKFLDWLEGIEGKGPPSPFPSYLKLS